MSLANSTVDKLIHVKHGLIIKRPCAPN